MIHVVVAIGVLQSGDVTGTALDFEIGFEDFDVHEFALHGIVTLGACAVESEIAVMSEDEAVQLLLHLEFL